MGGSDSAVAELGEIFLLCQSEITFASQYELKPDVICKHLPFNAAF